MNGTHPRSDEVEVTLFGPGYGECAVVHVGGGDWIVLDSFLASDGRPVALQYFDDLGLDSSRFVRLIVATQWHDDHMKGLSELVARCPDADFCCANALNSREFMGVATAWANESLPARGIREIHAVMNRLDDNGAQPIWATASRRIHRSSSCEVWSFSPDDGTYSLFLKSLEHSLGTGHLAPNRLSVALLMRFDNDVSCLFGADLERSGWTAMLRDDRRPRCRSSIFKVPHHGSVTAHLQGVWDELLEHEPNAILTPWRRGKGSLPNDKDVGRILARTPNAYATTGAPPDAVEQDRWVRKKLKGVKARTAPESGPLGMIRLRRLVAREASWRVELFESACPLRDFAA